MNWNRRLSVLLVGAYALMALFTAGIEGVLVVFFFSLLPLACIWFSDLMGAYTGPSSTIFISEPTPGPVVCVLGWLWLLFPVIASVLQSL